MAANYVLVSDVDGTLLGDGDALRAFAAWFADGAAHAPLRLAYASGRFFGSLHESIETSALPAPDAIIGGVGSEIVEYPSGEAVAGWREQIGRDWDAQRVRTELAGERDLEPQPDACQSPFKVSYFCTHGRVGEFVRMREALERVGVAADFIYSSQRDLDIVPRGVNKGSAAHFLASQWSIPPQRVFVAGDSGNDRSLFEAGFRGIVVANAHEELKRLDSGSVYQASKPFAAGVLEGLQHWLNAGRA